MQDLDRATGRALGVAVSESWPLAVGFGLVGLKARLADGRMIAVKACVRAAAEAQQATSSLALEGYMLRELARRTSLPVPEVYHADERLLVMAWIEASGSGGGLSRAAQHHAAELLAELHRLPVGDEFGYERDTVIGPLLQPNRPDGSWISFFRDQRLLYMARLAFDAGELPGPLLRRIERLAERLPDHISEPAQPSLIHGDLWGGNILAGEDRIIGVIDPAIYHADREIELAFTTMFGTFGAPFFDAYQALLPLEPEFHEHRCDLYNLYPALVHVRLFGAGYLSQVTNTLKHLGL